MKNKKRKGQITVQVLIEIVSVIIIVFIILLGFKAFGSMKEKTREATSIETEEMLKTDIETIALRVGSSERAVYNIPEGVAKACFIDTSVEPETIPLISEYPIIRDLLEGDPDLNLFLVYGSNKIEALSIGPVCIPPFPHYICLNTTAQKLDIILEGKGNCTIIRDVLSIKGMNLKNLNKYPDGVVFVVPESAGQKDISRLISLAFWKEGTDAIIYPLMVMYESSAEMTKEDYLLPLSDNNIEYEKIVVFGEMPQPLSSEEYIVAESFEDYFTYWLDYDDIIILSDEYENPAIKAGLFAASLNAPLAFISEENVHMIRDKYQNKKVHIIGSMPKNIMRDIEKNAREISSIQISDAVDPNINPFLQLSSTPLIELP